jgi:hypothetical protein
MDINQETVRFLFRYHSDTGEIRWANPSIRAAKVGQIAGSLGRAGYRRISIDGKRIMAHKIAWLYEYGVMPKAEIDHINGDKSDNRVGNLRLATKSQNEFNKGKTARNSSGFKGVSRCDRLNKWLARCMVNGKSKYLGSFETPELASRAYEQFAKINHGEFYNNNKGEVYGY